MILTPARLNILFLAYPWGVEPTPDIEVDLRSMARAGLLRRDGEGVFKRTSAGDRRARAEMCAPMHAFEKRRPRRLVTRSARAGAGADP